MSAPTSLRRSTADIVFDELREEIMALELLPGTKLSEAEVAAKFGVSRQPVREAFNLLGNQGLLVIQPQKASRVQTFSSKRIEEARFVRRAIEIEVGRLACVNWSDVYRPGFQRCLEAQERAVTEGNRQAFHKLDENFHALVADVAGVPFAFDKIRQSKAHIDRICVLSLKEPEEMADLVADHTQIYACLSKSDFPGFETALRLHLSRIETTIAIVRQSHPDFFSD